VEVSEYGEITTTNFQRRDANALSDRLVVEQILGA